MDYCYNNKINDYRLNYLNDIYSNTNIQKIKEIEETVNQTYCIEMPETHKFLQNGFRAWNCQGSGFSSAIVALDGGSYILNNAELLYTALTRAKKYCVLVGKK